MKLVFHIEKRLIDFYSGYALDLDEVVKVCRNFGVEELVLINETEEPVKILDSKFKWSVYENLESFEEFFGGEILYLETPWQHPAKDISEVDLEGKAVVIGPTRGLKNKDNYININQVGEDAFYPTNLVPIVCYEYFRSWQ